MMAEKNEVHESNLCHFVVENPQIAGNLNYVFQICLPFPLRYAGA